MRKQYYYIWIKREITSKNGVTTTQTTRLRFTTYLEALRRVMDDTGPDPDSVTIMKGI